MTSKTVKSAPGKTSRHPFLKEFWTGFTDLSALSLAVCIALFVISVGAALYLFSPRTMAGKGGDFIARSALDADAHTTVEAIRLGANEAKHPRVLILGSSTIAQAFGPALTLHEELERGTGQTWDVHMLTTPLQSPMDQLTILETALASQDKDSPATVVVIGSGTPRIAWTRERQIESALNQRIGLRSNWADEELVRLGGTPEPRASSYVIENKDFFILRGMKSILRALLQQPAHREIDSFARGTVPADRSAWVTNRTIDSIENLPSYVDQLDRFAQRISTIPNTTMVLIDEPFLSDPAQAERYNDVSRKFQNAVIDLAATNDAVQYWPVISDADLTAQHYYDPLHLQKGAPQTMCQTELAERLITLAKTSGFING